jgi:peptide/nickel transport system permease protein
MPHTFSSTDQLSDNYVVRNLRNGLRNMIVSRSSKVYFSILVTIILLGIFGPAIAPYDIDKSMYVDGDLLRAAPPSLDHPLGTTIEGYDIFSRVLHGARPTVIAGLLGGALIIAIGASIGITAGYMGGRVDSILMRITDFAYSVPLIPFAIVLIAFFDIGFIRTIVVIGLLLWRGNARVLRSQVLQIKEQPYVQSAIAMGASKPRIIIKHVLPNVLSMGILFFALGMGYTIIIQASLAFIGVSDPFVPSWGIMIRNAYNSGLLTEQWTWSIVPGLLISITVLATFMFGREYEAVSGQTDDTLARGG